MSNRDNKCALYIIYSVWNGPHVCVRVVGPINIERMFGRA